METRSMMSMGQPLWDDIKILGFVSMSIRVYVGHRYQKFGLSYAHYIACKAVSNTQGEKRKE